MRPDGPEPFLLLAEDQAWLDFHTGLLHLTNPITLNSSDAEHGLVMDAGAYDLRDPSLLAQLIGPVINPDFIRQAQHVVDVQTQLSEHQKLIAEFWEDGSGVRFLQGPGCPSRLTWLPSQSCLSQMIFSSTSQLVNHLAMLELLRGMPNIISTMLGLFESFVISPPSTFLGRQPESWSPYQLPGSDPSPPFPEYVSGPSRVSTAAVGVLRTYFGSDQLDLAITVPAGGSRFEPGVTPIWPTTLSWPTLTLAAEEAGASRLYGGIHFEDGNQDGLTLGTAVSELVLAQAQTYAYDKLDQQLMTPFLLANQAEVFSSSGILIDGSFVEGITTLNLAAGDDKLEIHPSGNLTGIFSGGAGNDLLSFTDWSEPVWVVMDSPPLINSHWESSHSLKP